MKQQNKFSQNQEHVEEQQMQPNTAREFASSDELLRYDAGQTAVPPEIAQRLQKSACDLPKPKPAFWKRFLGGNNS